MTKKIHFDLDDTERATKILEILDDHYGEVGCTLNYQGDPWLLLVGGILAAQATDERVNKILPDFLAKYPTIEDVALSSQEEMEDIIRTVGLFRNKAKWIRGSAAKILEDFDGEVPKGEKELLSLPGVGRKIANLIRGDAFGIPGVVVDTHCGRITRHLGLSEAKNPATVEKDLKAILPQSLWIHWGHMMVHHGRNLCPARSPQCSACPVEELCVTGRQEQLRVQAQIAEQKEQEKQKEQAEGGQDA